MKGAAENSPLAHVTKDDAPTLLIAGDEDKLVPVSHSRNMHAAMKEAKVTCDLLEIKGAGHGIQGEGLQRSIKAMLAWFDKHLAKSETPKDGAP